MLKEQEFSMTVIFAGTTAMNKTAEISKANEI